MDILSLSTLSNAFTSVKLTSIKTKYADKRQKERAQELTAQQRERQSVIEKMQQQAEADRKAAKLSSIQTKFKNGGQLTSEEIAYMRQESPGSYEELLKQKSEAEAYEKALQNCSTKEDVSQVHMVKLSQFMTEANAVCNNPVIPKDKKLEIMLKLRDRLEGISKAQTEFVTSEEHARLPSMYDEEPKTEETEEEKPEEKVDDPAEAPVSEEKPAADSEAPKTNDASETDEPAKKAEGSTEKKSPAPADSEEKPEKIKPVRTKKKPAKSARVDAESVKQFISFEIERLSGFKSKKLDTVV